MANTLLFSYKLLNNDAIKSETSDGLFVNSWGSAAEQGRKYWLEISAQTSGDWNSNGTLQSIDLTLNFDNRLFKPAVASDLTIDSRLPLFRSANLSSVSGSGADALQSSIRFAAGSSDNVEGGGAGIVLSSTESKKIARILLDVNDSYFKTNTLTGADQGTVTDITLQDETAPLSLKLDQLVSFTVNKDETIFGDLKSLRDIGGSEAEVANTSVNVLRGTQAVEIRGATFNTYEPLGTSLHFGAAAGSKTNLIRSGSTLSRSFDIANTGTSSLQNLVLTKEGSLSPDTATAKLSATRSARASDGNLTKGSTVELTADVKTLSASTDDNSLGLVRDASGAVSSSLKNQADVNNSGDLLTMKLDVNVTGAAGTALELNNTGGFTLKADGFTKTFTGLDTKNLITYQGDLNYDGKVSFADLAYLNAGAAESKKKALNQTYTDFSDVDANFDGTINISDLSVLEKDWGETLHGSGETFTGSTSFGATTAEWKTSMTTFNSEVAWTNSAFEHENNLTAANTVMPTLDSPTNSGVTTGGVNNDGTNTDVFSTSSPFANLS